MPLTCPNLEPVHIARWDLGPPGGLWRRVLSLPHPVFLDSGSDVGGQGGWSFLMAQPAAILTSVGDRVRLVRPDGGRTRWSGDPFRTLQQVLAETPREGGGEIPFIGGAVGYWSYDLRYHIERLPRTGTTAVRVPQMWVGLYDTLYAWNHRHERGYLVSARLEGWQARLASLRAALEGPAVERYSVPLTHAGSLTSNFSRDEYLAAVGRVKEYIAAGDIYQANLSQRFTAPVEMPAAELYDRLRQISPAPFAAYLGCGNFQVLSSSPERFLRIRGGEVETRPIKGTRPRGSTPDEDARLATELLASAKDRAELVMIVDLERNDLGRVCEFGSVRTTELFALETHPTVHHLVATVQGQLREGVMPLEALRACFPGGSITGAPKIRAMEIIEELEPTHRGIYTGAIGYVGFDGSAEWNIAIRTLLLKAGRAYFQAGGGIVADSDPAAEYEETLHKARAMMRALAIETG